MTFALAGFTALASGVPTRTRQPRTGPETDLINRFLEHARFHGRGGVRVTVFREPKIASGFPDIVAVRWHEATAARWATARACLVTDELRLLHFLTVSGSSDEDRLRGHHFRRVGPSLERLAALGLVRRLRRGWRASPLQTTFAVRSIVAFEAKMSSWTAAIEQAFLNRWFASESYVLVPKEAPIHGLVAAACEFGVGVWTDGAKAPVLRAVKNDTRQPISYASWLFNDWSWRHAVGEAR